MRFLKEWLRPQLKCKRLGHEWASTTVRGFEYPSQRGGVCDSIFAVTQQCCRCGVKQALDDAKTVREPIHSLEMDQRLWDELKINGRLYT